MALLATQVPAMDERWPLTFTLCGREFLIQRVPFGALAALGETATTGETMDDMAACNAIIDFVAGVVSDPEGWRKAAVDLDAVTLLDLMSWVVEAATGIPTQPPSAQPQLLSTNGGSSSGGLPVSASTTL